MSAPSFQNRYCIVCEITMILEVSTEEHRVTSNNWFIRHQMECKKSQINKANDILKEML